MTPDPQELVTLIRQVIKNKGLYAVNEQKTKNGVVHPLFNSSISLLGANTLQSGATSASLKIHEPRCSC